MFIVLLMPYKIQPSYSKEALYPSNISSKEQKQQPWKLFLKSVWGLVFLFILRRTTFRQWGKRKGWLKLLSCSLLTFFFFFYTFQAAEASSKDSVYLVGPFRCWKMSPVWWWWCGKSALWCTSWQGLQGWNLPRNNLSSGRWVGRC